MRSTPAMFILFFSGIIAEETSTPSSLLTPRHFNHHPFQLKQYLDTIKHPEPTKQGPVLFPNDSPPPPRPPLVVTARPLLESIANSNLGPGPNNSVAEQTQIKQVVFRPDFNNQYAYTLAPIDYGPGFDPGRIQYVDREANADPGYDYVESSSLPPIYKALSDYAQNQVLKTNEQPYYKNNIPDYGRSYENNELSDGNDNSEYNQGDNYAFSYSVKDRNTGDDFSHRQHSSGSATNGEYRVRLPDGRMQIVSYTADENGYKADVRYDDEPNKSHVTNEVNKAINGNTNQKLSDYATKNQITDYTFNHETENDYTQRDFKIKPVKETYTDSAEYYSDYSAEYPNYESYKSKFAAFKPIPNFATTVRPSYKEIKELFTVKPYPYLNDRVEISSPSSPIYKDADNVVVIAPKLYTQVRSTPPFPTGTTQKPFIVTPASYLASTIASIRDRIKASKPILSNSFINRINKYLTFN